MKKGNVTCQSFSSAKNVQTKYTAGFQSIVLIHGLLVVQKLYFIEKYLLKNRFFNNKKGRGALNDSMAELLTTVFIKQSAKYII